MLAPLQVINWLNQYCISIEYQKLAPGARQKNRVILTFLNGMGDKATVGQVNLAAAVIKARSMQIATYNYGENN